MAWRCSATYLGFLSLAGLTLLLTGCELIVSTAYPDYVPLIQAEESVDRWVDGRESVLAFDASANPLETQPFLRVRTDSGEQEIVFFDEQPRRVVHYSEAELVAAAGGGVLGRLGYIDRAGRVTVGQFVFDDGLAPEPFSTGVDPDAVLVTRFDAEASGADRMLAFRVDNTSGDLVVQSADIAPVSPFEWTAPSSISNGPVGPGGPYRVEAGFAVDAEGVVGGEVLLLVLDESINRLHLMIFTYAELPPLVGVLPGPTPSYVEGPRTAVSFDDVAYDGVWITSWGVIVRSEDSATYRLYSFESGFDEEITFDGLEEIEHAAAFPPDESFFYILDYDRARILKLSNWWQ